MAMEIIIRPCRTDECSKILELWRDAGSTPSVSDSIEALNRVLQTEGGLLLVAETNDNIIGTIVGGWDGWRGNLYRLAVLPEYRRRGIGRKLVLEAEKQLAEKGVKKISVLIEKDEELAMDFWESMKSDDYCPDDRFIRYTKVL
jgi:ribosomal protein S18 acetylase RimI-like enzyme